MHYIDRICSRELGEAIVRSSLLCKQTVYSGNTEQFQQLVVSENPFWQSVIIDVVYPVMSQYKQTNNLPLN